MTPPPGNSATVDAETMVRAVGIHFGRRQLIGRWAVLVLCIYLAASGALLLLQQRYIWSALFIGASALFAAAATLGKHFLRRNVVKQYAQLGQEIGSIAYEVTDDALLMHTNNVSRRLEWTTIHKCRERDGLLLIYERDQFFHVVPIQQLSDSLQQQIRDHLPL